ncbi:MAG TPA: glutamine synthetase family protein [Dehalococcoidia bacterium]|nr:glutamine synthetase family protein [Dehalococcoidia bacterium]
MEEQKQYVLQTAKEHGIKFIRLWFTDILGALKSFAITVSELEGALEEGMRFDGSSIEGFARVDESDMRALPDPTTFQILPWRPTEQGVARMFCDIVQPDGSPFEGDPRHVLKRTLRRASELGYTFYVEPEIEFFYFRGPDSPEPLDQGGYFDLTPLDAGTDLRRETVLTLEQMGIPVEFSHHEVAPSQHEIDLRYTDALTMADSAMTYRLVVKEVAMRNGVYASFMPKPLEGENGSGMHIYMSLFRGDDNVFFDQDDPLNLSPLARSFIAGLLHQAREITLVTNQWVNSYKRLTPGYEAPVYATWGRHNRSDLVRVPDYKRGHEGSTRIEYRAPDSACNPYLTFAVLLAAGLRGIEREYPAPQPVARDVFSMSAEELRDLKIDRLPGSLYEAIAAAEDSDFLRETLGEHVHQTLIVNKKVEWEAYRNHISTYELRRYLPIL